MYIPRERLKNLRPYLVLFVAWSLWFPGLIHLHFGSYMFGIRFVLWVIRCLDYAFIFPVLACLVTVATMRSLLSYGEHDGRRNVCHRAIWKTTKRCVSSSGYQRGSFSHGSNKLWGNRIIALRQHAYSLRPSTDLSMNLLLLPDQHLSEIQHHGSFVQSPVDGGTAWLTRQGIGMTLGQKQVSFPTMVL